MRAHLHKNVRGSLKLDWKFLVKLFLSGLFTAIGIYQHMGPEKLELAIVALLVIPVIGILFSYLKQGMREKNVRLVIILLATLFVWITSDLSFFLALAFYMMLDGATQEGNINRASAFRWMNAVEVEDEPEHVSQLIAKHRLFTSIPEENRQELADACRCLKFNRGQKLISKGEMNTNLFFIAKGHVQVLDDGKVLASLKQSDVVGEVSASGLSLPIADVIAEDEVTVFALSLDQINDAVERFPEFGERMLRLARIRRAELATRAKIDMPPESIINRISRHQLFRVLPPYYRQMLAEECRVYQLEKDGLLIRQGEFNSNLYLIAKGFIQIIKDDELVATLGEGDIVGEISSSGISMPVADVMADSTVIAYAFPAELINKAAGKCPEFSRKLSEIGMLRENVQAEGRSGTS